MPRTPTGGGAVTLYETVGLGDRDPTGDGAVYLYETVGLGDRDPTGQGAVTLYENPTGPTVGGWTVGAVAWGCECRTVYTGCDTVTDNFNRADAGDGTLGTSGSGHRWTNVTGPFDAGLWTTQGTTVNTAQAQVPVIDHYRAMGTLLNAHGNNQDISVDGEAADDNSIGVLARFSADGMNGYHVLYTAYADNTVTKFVDGVPTTLGSIPRISPNTAFTGRVVVKNDLLKVYLNGTLRLTVDIMADDANCHCETDWTYLGFREDHGGSGGSAPTQITVYTNTHWDNLSAVAP